MRKLALITQIDFWRMGAGARERARALAKFLARNTDFCILYIGSHNDTDKALARRTGYRVLWCAETEREMIGLWINSTLKNLGIDVVVARGCNNDWLPKYIPEGCISIVDVDDLEFEVAGLPCDSPEAIKEVKSYQDYNYLALIQSEHHQIFLKYYPAERLIMASHPVMPMGPSFRQEALRIGYLASGWHHNIEALNWFIKNVLPLLGGGRFSFDIYGYICSVIANPGNSNIRLMGAPMDVATAYRSIDVFVNPAQTGSGVKVKTLEAMAFGLPVVATREGARGLGFLNNSALCIEDEPERMAETISLFIRDLDLRMRYGWNAYNYVKKFHNPSACFGELLSVVNKT